MKQKIVFTLVLFGLLFSNIVNACAFDTDCSIGSYCLKGNYSLYGYCAGGMFPGNNNDSTPAYNLFDMTGKQGNTCSFDIECGIGGFCYKEGYNLYGVCL